MLDSEQFLLSREQFGMRFGLERMRRLLALVGDPQDELPAVHVVGTNGKSSTARLTAAALGAQGLRAGCFTSPHLRRFSERVTVAGAELREAEFEAATDLVRDAIEQLDATSGADDRVTQFEAINAIALVSMRVALCDVAVVEAGLGGRLDSTNVLGDSRVQVLTGVGLDHTEYLGETLAEIAREKLAVVRDGGVLVTGALLPEMATQAAAVARERNAALVAADAIDPAFDSIAGEFVRRNASVAFAAARAMWGRLSRGAFAEREAVEAIHSVIDGRQLEGRLAVHGRDPLVIFDSAHNADAAAALAAALRELAGARPVTLVLSLLGDKPVEPTLSPLLPLAGAVVCTGASNPRALTAAELRDRVLALATDAALHVESDPHAALALARELAGLNGCVVATGSNYLVGDLLKGRGAAGGATF